MKQITKQIKDAILDLLMSRIDHANYGVFSNYRISRQSEDILEFYRIRVTSELCTADTVTLNGETVATVNYRYAARKINGMCKMLKPQIIYV